MKEILFKAKSIDNDEWIEGNYFHSEREDKHYIQNDWNDYGYDCVEVKPETVFQFIGKYGKDDTKLFENDQVKVFFGNDERRGRLSFKYKELPEFLIGTVTYSEQKCGYIIVFEENNPHNACSCEFGWYGEGFQLIND